MQTIRNPLSIFRARSRERSSSITTQSEKSEKQINDSSGKKKTSTQKLFVKRDKNASECLAETRIEKKSYCREKTQKSIILKQPMVNCTERVEKTVRAPNNNMMGTKCVDWNYIQGANPIVPGTSKSVTDERIRMRPVDRFSTEMMIAEIFAPLRDTIESGIRKSKSSSSTEKPKHTPSIRLEQWKAQLNSGSTRTRDHSAPAPVQRLTIKPRTTQLNVPDVPRPLHVTKSANNAMLAMDHRTLRDSSLRGRSGTWQPVSTNFDKLPVDFVTSPRFSQQEGNIFRPIACKPNTLNHNDSNKISFKKVEPFRRSASNESNASLAELLQLYHPKDSMREMNLSLRSNASNSLSFPLSPNNNNNNKTLMATMSSSSSGIHVTPSPSDSGIIDYENVIRDKELELQEIRATMEQNEEIIIKVYQDKERAWKTELEGLKGRLSASEKGEKALREQLSNCQRQNAAMTTCMKTLQDEKNKMMSRCIQLEKEIEHLQNYTSRNVCPNCSKNQNNEEKDLRQEVRDLRREVANLKKVVDDGINYKS
ncbi:unnamed protein product [Caenorhabditis bovis]|uniref:Uncharacterized protein n=1 Tax=Caenorhabditis bovis TaxID=2654633 RepID=A0A8S1EIP5_9PELO|nr:unnamed protein product [Caenorhabditis bovis]